MESRQNFFIEAEKTRDLLCKQTAQMAESSELQRSIDDLNAQITCIRHALQEQERLEAEEQQSAQRVQDASAVAGLSDVGDAVPKSRQSTKPVRPFTAGMRVKTSGAWTLKLEAWHQG